MNWEVFLIPITESDTSAKEWHNGTLSEWEEYYGKAKKIDKDYYELFVNNQHFIFLVDPKTNIIIAKAYYKKSIHTIDGFIVDSDYRNEIGVILDVKDPVVYLNDAYLRKGQALAQLDFAIVPDTELQVVEELDETERTGGFGKMNGE